MGAYRESEKTVYGSPILGVKALDEIRRFFVAQTTGLTPMTTAILFEEDQDIYKGLLATLEEQGYADRIKRTDDLSTVRDGDIAVIIGDSSQYVDTVLGFMDVVEPTYSFHFIDPYGSKGVERINLEKIVSRKRADCIITMMLNYSSRWMMVATKTGLNPTEQAHARFLDRYYGSGVWRDIAHKIASGTIDRREAEHLLVDAFDAILHGADTNLAVKQIPLRFQDREQTLYSLFLTTHDPTGAFRMNEILADARIREYDYRVEKRQMRTQPGQLNLGLFDEVPDQRRPTEPQPDIDLLAEQIYTVCRTQTIQFREILRKMVNSPYFVEDVKEALGKLREQKRASFQGAPSRLPNTAEITFV